MSRIPHWQQQYSSIKTQNSSTAIEQQLFESFQHLSTPSSSPELSFQQIQRLAKTPIGPFSTLLHDHVVGEDAVTHVRGHLQELLQGNLPPTILDEVFSPRWLSARRLLERIEKKGTVDIEGSRRKVYGLSNENNATDAELRSKRHLIQQASTRQSEMIEFNAIGMVIIERLRLYHEQIDNERHTTEVQHSKGQPLTSLPNLDQHLEEYLKGNLKEMSQLEIISMFTGTPPILDELLDEVNRLLALDGESRDSVGDPDTLNEFNVVMKLQSCLLSLKNSIKPLSKSEKEALDKRLASGEGSENWPRRDEILETAHSNVNHLLMSNIQDDVPHLADDREGFVDEESVAALHEITSKLFKTAQDLSIVSREASVQVLSEIVEELPQMQDELAFASDKIEDYLDDKRDSWSIVEGDGRRFTSEVCSILGIPDDTDPDIILQHVQNLLKEKNKT
ncbi:hypothetical protein CPB86DRAFT_876256 [Serendipita vermifera]|nr:hypothetical protein CPB86DRAFT_876256 [Serendipita vermifera]